MKLLSKNQITNKKSGKLNYQSGFTFMELIVVIAIMAIMESIIMFNYKDFTSNISLKNLASDIALSIKKAQTLALSGRSDGFAQDTDLDINNFANRQSPTYGAFFANDADGTVQNVHKQNEFVIFKDRDFSGDYYAGSDCETVNIPGTNTECLDRITVPTKEKIDKICVDVGTQAETCSVNSFKGLAITFKRPYPDAIINLVDSQNNVLSTNHLNAEITISPANDSNAVSRVIRITNLGQITTK